MLPNPFLSAQEQMRTAYEFLRWQYDHEFEKLLFPDRVIEVTLPVTRDDGSTQIFTGYRSQHNNVRGPYKWGIRYHQDVTKDEVIALSTWMSIKCATLDLPLGGGKWGIIVDPRTLSKRELEALSRGWVQKLYKYIWPTDDVPAPDVNTNGEIMAWMVDEYSKLVWHWSPGTFTGKPLSIGGSLGRDTATAQGGAYVLEAYLETQNKTHSRENLLAWKKIIVQWAGNAWGHMMEILSKKWAIIIGTSDSQWAIYDSRGLDVGKVKAIKSEKKSLREYFPSLSSESEGNSVWVSLTNAELLEKPCDVLVPAALENQITSENADRIQAQLILELANGPVTPQADSVLFEKWIPVIPDILANAGGVTVSYFEQVQNNMNYFWSAEEVQTKLKGKMETALHSVVQSANEHHVMLRTGAYVIALRRILEAMKVRGE